jgi:hypothetical protein
MHHFQPWNGDNSDQLGNVICVCPNHHAMFELASLRWHEGTLLEWSPNEWTPRPLAVDRHLAVALEAANQAPVSS